MSDIRITIKNYRCFPDENPARINLKKGFAAFLGVNNSGKSSLLRFFYEFRNLFAQLSTPSGDVIEAIRGNARAFTKPEAVLDIAEVFHKGNTRNMEIQIELPGSDTPKGWTISLQRDSNIWRLSWPLPGVRLEPKRFDFTNDGHLRHEGKYVADFSPLFRACKDLYETLYIGPFRNAINVGSGPNYFDIHVGQTFIEQWRRLKTGPVVKNREATFRLTEDIKHLFGYDQLEINPSEDNKTLQLFINGKSHNLYEVGSGLTQFILVLANAAVRKPAYILIDEPELNLHPILQRDFLTTVASYSREGVLFATHSIGLARSIAPTIYSVRLEREGASKITNIETTPRLSEFLGELSFSGYKELGFDKILLVEGPTDVATIQQFLRALQKDHSVVLLPLGGSAGINASAEAQLNEIKRISDNVHALIDSERTQAGATLPANINAFSIVCQNANIRCCILERRALENYLSDHAVKKVKGEKYRALGPYEKLDHLDFPWSKDENWRIAREMSERDWGETDLGIFLSTL